MVTSHALTGNFALNTYAVTLTAIGDGTAAKNPDLASYNHGTSVTFTATPNAGQSFASWAGDTTTSTNPLQIIITRPRTLQARFTASVTATVVGSGSVARVPNQTAYPLGSTVHLPATPPP